MPASRTTALLLALLPALAPGAGAAPRRPQPGPAAARPDDRGGWADAEALARKHLARKHRRPTQLAPYPALPYLFAVAYAGGGEHLLVSGGRVVTDRGLGALAAYAEGAGLAGRAELTARDFLHLVEVLGAYPPVTGYAAPPGYYSNTRQDAPLSPLNPKLAREGGGLRFELSYLIRTPPGPGAGSPTAAAIVHVGRWTLRLAPGAPAEWREERIDFDSRSGRRRAE